MANVCPAQYVVFTLPWSSTAFTSAWQLISSATMPSTASRAARINGVVPSFIRASKSVTLLRIRIWTRGEDRFLLWSKTEHLAETQEKLCNEKAAWALKCKDPNNRWQRQTDRMHSEFFTLWIPEETGCKIQFHLVIALWKAWEQDWVSRVQLGQDHLITEHNCSKMGFSVTVPGRHPGHQQLQLHAGESVPCCPVH